MRLCLCRSFFVGSSACCSVGVGAWGVQSHLGGGPKPSESCKPPLPPLLSLSLIILRLCPPESSPLSLQSFSTPLPCLSSSQTLPPPLSPRERSVLCAINSHPKTICSSLPFRERDALCLTNSHLRIGIVMTGTSIYTKHTSIHTLHIHMYIV